MRVESMREFGEVPSSPALPLKHGNSSSTRLLRPRYPGASVVAAAKGSLVAPVAKGSLVAPVAKGSQVWPVAKAPSVLQSEEIGRGEGQSVPGALAREPAAMPQRQNRGLQLLQAKSPREPLLPLDTSASRRACLSHRYSDPIPANPSRYRLRSQPNSSTPDRPNTATDSDPMGQLATQLLRHLPQGPSCCSHSAPLRTSGSRLILRSQRFRN